MVIRKGAVHEDAESFCREWTAGLVVVEEMAYGMLQDGPLAMSAVAVADVVVHCQDHATFADARAHLEKVVPGILERVRASSEMMIAPVK
jgi:hypothetical protein